MDKFIKGLTIIAAGGVAIKTIKEINRRKRIKEIYELETDNENSNNA